MVAFEDRSLAEAAAAANQGKLISFAEALSEGKKLGLACVKVLLQRLSPGRGVKVLSNPPKNTPSIAVGLDGDEFGIVGASPTINLLVHC